MDTFIYIKAALILVGLAVLLYICARLFQHYFPRLSPLASRAKVTSVLPIDAQRRLITITQDDREFTLLLGPHNDIYVHHTVLERANHGTS